MKRRLDSKINWTGHFVLALEIFSWSRNRGNIHSNTLSLHERLSSLGGFCIKLLDYKVRTCSLYRGQYKCVLFGVSTIRGSPVLQRQKCLIRKCIVHSIHSNRAKEAMM